MEEGARILMDVHGLSCYIYFVNICISFCNLYVVYTLKKNDVFVNILLFIIFGYYSSFYLFRDKSRVMWGMQ